MIQLTEKQAAMILQCLTAIRREAKSDKPRRYFLPNCCDKVETIVRTAIRKSVRFGVIKTAGGPNVRTRAIKPPEAAHETGNGIKATKTKSK